MQLLHANDTLGQHAPSWYAATSEHTHYPELKSAIETDVCIIGGGYTGLSTALHLSKAGINTVVLEAHRVGWGASGRNGGQLGTGFNMMQDVIEAKFGKPTAIKLWQICEDAKKTILELCQQNQIDIEYTPGIVYALHRKRFVAQHHAYCNKLRDEYAYEPLQTLGREQLQDRVGSNRYYGGSVDHGAGHVHPLKLAHGLANIAHSHGASIHELSQVEKIDYKTGRINTGRATVTAKHIILACNGYLDGLDPKFSRRVFPINNFMVATEPLGDRAHSLLPFNEAVADSRYVVNYYRLSHDGRLLFGGGENYGYRFPRDISKTVRPAMLRIFPQLADARIDYAWGGTLAITPKRVPAILRINERTLAAGGYSGHGVALSCMYGKAMAEAFLGDEQKLKLLKNLPTPVFPGGSRIRPALQTLAMTTARTLDFF